MFYILMKQGKNEILVGNEKTMSINDLCKVIGDTLAWEVLEPVE